MTSSSAHCAVTATTRPVSALQARVPLCLQNQNITGRTNQCSIQEDEILAKEVRQYPCLYDKSNSEYKDAIRKKNA